MHARVHTHTRTRTHARGQGVGPWAFAGAELRVCGCTQHPRRPHRPGLGAQVQNVSCDGHGASPVGNRSLDNHTPPSEPRRAASKASAPKTTQPRLRHEDSPWSLSHRVQPDCPDVTTP